jgi:hypothetical protein
LILKQTQQTLLEMESWKSTPPGQYKNTRVWCINNLSVIATHCDGEDIKYISAMILCIRYVLHVYR